MHTGSNSYEVQDLLLFDDEESQGSVARRMPMAHSSENAFEEFKLKMVMRIYGISRDIAKKYIARRKGEVEALYRKRTDELVNAERESYMLDL